jgi:CPA2 family monovalent cation:H+ antiporter-2
MILNEIVIIFGLTVAVLLICSRLRIPTIVGFLLSGMLAGPFGLKLVPMGEHVDMLADIGVVLLLFTIGLEFSIKKILKIRRFVSVGGSLQVGLTILFTALLMLLFDFSPAQAVFAGFLTSLSSTAIVLKLYQQKDEINSPHGRVTLGILIFQDLVVVPMMLLVPILSGQSSNISMALLILLAKAGGIIALTIVSARWVVPFILFQVARIRSNDIFILCIIVLCFAVAWLTSSIGLSLSLGAFLAGLIISESEYSHQAFSTIMPFRDVFTSFFFISIGMLFDYHFLLDHPFLVGISLIIILFLKTLSGSIATYFTGMPVRPVLLTGFALSQIGEFAFVLSKSGIDAGLLTDQWYQLFLSVSILTMATSPFMLQFSQKLVVRVETWTHPQWLIGGLRRQRRGEPKDMDAEQSVSDHLVIIGFGVIGVNVAKAAALTNIPYMIIEMNAETVRRERKKGTIIYYGDATQEANLRGLNVHKAKVVVVAIPDSAATRAIVGQVHKLNPLTMIIVRTRYVREMKPLYKLGATEVIPEEFEASVEMFTQVLSKYLFPRDVIEHVAEQIRKEGYEVLRTQKAPSLSMPDLQKNIAGLEISTFTVPQSSPLAWKSLAETDLRQQYEVSLLAIIRGSQAIKNPDGDEVLEPGDRIVVFGATEFVRSFEGKI